jgi:hypothetical protein
MPKADEFQAELLVWTDIDPQQEDDFNRWYDREHMAERVAIPGFLWARRYRAVDERERRYLALYRAESFGSFTSPAYKKAFQNQTEWSNRTFRHMLNTQRRVCAVTPPGYGYGYGGALALLPLPDSASEAATLMAALEAVARRDGTLGARLLVPNPDLSTPLPSEKSEGRRLQVMAVVETAQPEAAQAALDALTAALSLPTGSGAVFRLLWGLTKRDLEEAATPEGAAS